MLKIAMLSTGEEVLYGDIIDTNASWLSERFFEQGFPMSYRSTVGDQLDVLIGEIKYLSEKNDVVIVNGGLGPTSDDMSSLAAAKACGVELELNEEWLTTMTAYFANIQREMPESNIKQAMLPMGAVMIPNPVGTACGFSIELNGAVIIFTPGVPSEFKQMTIHEILPRLKARFPQVSTLACNKVYTFGLTESGIADSLEELNISSDFTLGYRSYSPFIEVKLFGPKDHSDTDSVIRAIMQKLNPNVLGHNMNLIDSLGGLLLQSNSQVMALERASGGAFSREMYQNLDTMNAFTQSQIINRTSDIEGVVDLDAAIYETKEFAEQLRGSVDLYGHHAHQESASDDELDINNDEPRKGIVIASLPLAEQEFAVVVIGPAPELSGERCIWAQHLRFRRQNSINNQQVLISTVMQDMLRRLLKKESLFVEYVALEQVKTQIITR